MLNFNKGIMIGCLSIAVAGALTGCENLKEREARNTGRSSAQVVTDESTDHRVKEAMHNSPVYKFPGVGVQTFNSVVQLNGFVDTQNQKHAAEEIARTVAGVERVENNIAIKSEVAPTGRGNGEYHAPIINFNEQAPQPRPNVPDNAPPQ